MAFKETGEVYPPKKISIMICDVCGKDIGLPDGYGENPHFTVTYETKDQYKENTYWDVCSKECLIILAMEKL